MTLIVTGVGTLIHVYSTGYMTDDESYARYFAYLNLFLFFMLCWSSAARCSCCSSAGKAWACAPTC